MLSCCTCHFSIVYRWFKYLSPMIPEITSNPPNRPIWFVDDQLCFADAAFKKNLVFSKFFEKKIVLKRQVLIPKSHTILELSSLIVFIQFCNSIFIIRINLAAKLQRKIERTKKKGRKTCIYSLLIPNL